ncbi:MAG: hypothetical protein M3R01_04700, partial [Actinomycetota bacterium]|nr:hypothetical protein [Actinomycetota bacterium]
MTLCPLLDGRGVPSGGGAWEHRDVMRRLGDRPEWRFFAILPQAHRGLATAWFVLLFLRGALPAGFAVAMGLLVRAVERGDDLADPLTLVGVIFVV